MSEEMNKQNAADATNPNQPFVERRRFNNVFPVWQSRVWMIVVLGFGLITVLCILYACYMLENEISILTEGLKKDPLMALTGTGMLGAQFLRGLSILMGGAVIFGGLSISFFSGQDTHIINGEVNESVKAKVSLSTRTPGVLGVITGGIIIVYALYTPYTYQHNAGSYMSSTNVVPPNVQKDSDPSSTPKGHHDD
ncbi:hypothetical protein [Candidatus Pantoea multigeneris]|uniref:Uncharacterized protein n=1 Tax=Candidatus Pantoea multigeneris TaxID=2608357 RepID=A0ABX0RAF4_9GAMM|nr:hypothetical protein [Pantoea multigeneris]NIF21754.1 hypothetical protein [Pantoea multigeneris]